MNIWDALRQYIGDAVGGSINPEASQAQQKLAQGLLSVNKAFDDQAMYRKTGQLPKGMTAKQVNDAAGELAINMASLAPTGIIRDLKTPEWNMMRRKESFPLGDWRNDPNPVPSEVKELMRDIQARTEEGDSLRTLNNKKTNQVYIGWPYGAALHGDVETELGIPIGLYKRSEM